MHFRASKSIFDEYVDDFVKFFFNPQPVLNFRFDIAEHVKQLAGSVLTFIHFHNFDNYLLNSIVQILWNLLRYLWSILRFTTGWFNLWCRNMNELSMNQTHHVNWHRCNKMTIIWARTIIYDINITEQNINDWQNMMAHIHGS